MHPSPGAPHIVVADPELAQPLGDPQLTPPGQPAGPQVIPPVAAPRAETRRRVDDTEPEQQEDPEKVTELTDEERGWFNTLLTVGRRHKAISVMGHIVAIRNLNTDDDLRVGLWCKEFQDAPPATQRSYQLAVCAAGIRSIDGVDLVTPLRQLTDDELFAEKVAALRKYYPVVITQVYNEILKLDAEFYELATKLGKAGG